MLAPSPNPQAAPKRELSADHIRELLAASGYGNADAAVRKRYSLPAGSGLSLQFGEHLTVNGDGVPHSTLCCDFVLNGNEPLAGYAACWTAAKVVRTSAGGDQGSLAMDVRLVLGSGVFLEDIRIHGADVFRHLRLLLADARATLLSLPVADETVAGADGPALRIEARFIGDLAAGRSGFVGGRAAGDGKSKASAAHPGMVRISPRRQQALAAACDCLADRIVPDLARALRRLIAREMVSMRRKAPCEIELRRHPASQSHASPAAQARPSDIAKLARTLSYDPPP
jgi:hypothetical protein